MRPAYVRCGLRVCVVAIVLLATACTDRRPTSDTGALPVAPTAYPTGPASTGPGVAEISQDIQAITIRIEDGHFGADVYDAQTRPARLEVWASGGPYTLAIDGLLQPRSLEPAPGGGAIVIGLTPPGPGEFTMRLSGASTDTATLNVRPPGQR